MAISAQRIATISLVTDPKGVAPGIKDAERQLRMFQREQAKEARTAAREQARASKEAARAAAAAKRDVGGIGRSILGGAAALAGFDIGGGLLSLGEDVMAVEKQLLRFQIAAGEGFNMATFRDQLGRSSTSLGVARGELMKGAAQYLAITGDAKGAATAMDLFGRVANATGANMEDIAATAAAMHQNLKIDPKDFQPAFDILIMQGKAGAVELKDLATQLANVAPQFAQFAGARSVDGLAEMGAMLQVVREGFGDADQAATGFRGMMTEINRHAKNLAKFGINIIDPKTGKTKDLLAIIKEIAANRKLMTATNQGDPLLGALEEEKAVRAVRMLIGNLQEVDELKNRSLGSDAVAKDNATYLNSTTGRLAVAWERVKGAAAEALTTERIETFTSAVEKAIAATGSLGEKAGGLLGGIYDIGASIRGFFSKPFDMDYGDLMKSTNPDASRIMMIASGVSPEDADAQIALAKRRAANVRAGNAAAYGIEGAEENGKKSKASIREAFAAIYGSAPGMEGANARLIGRNYLRDSKVDDPVARAMGLASMNQREFARALASELGRSIERALGKAPATIVKMDASAVAQSIRNAPANRSRRH